VEALDKGLRARIDAGIEDAVRLTAAGQKSGSRNTSPISTGPMIFGPLAPL
jgi:hypothetical protein